MQIKLGWLIFGGASWLAQSGEGPWQQIGGLFGILPGLFIVVGIAFLPAGILGLLAGYGVLLRKEWGRILALILAVLAILLGLIWISGVEDIVQDAKVFVLGASQILYGVVAFLILLTKGDEFSRDRDKV